MPLYEYLCDNCHTKFELRRAMKQSDDPATCPECQSDRVERQISLFVGITRESGHSAAPSGACACGGACSCAGPG